MDSWGWNRVADLSAVNTDEFLSGEDQTLRIELGIRPESYRVLYETCVSAQESVKRKWQAMKRAAGGSD